MLSKPRLQAASNCCISGTAWLAVVFGISPSEASMQAAQHQANNQQLCCALPDPKVKPQPGAQLHTMLDTTMNKTGGHGTI